MSRCFLTAKYANDSHGYITFGVSSLVPAWGSSHCPAASHHPCLESFSLCILMAGIQRAVAHACDARCSGDLDRQGSHPHQHEAARDAAGFLQISAAEHQTPR